MVIVWSDVLPPNNIYDLVVLDDAVVVVLVVVVNKYCFVSEYFQPTSTWTCNNFRVIQAGLINHT